MTENYFNELIDLSKEKKSRFKIEGSKNKFLIKCSTDNILLSIMLVIIIGLPTIFLIQNYNNPVSWIIETGLILIILLFIRYFPLSNDILVDSDTKQILITNSNFIGKHIVPKVKIDFDDVTKISNKKVSIRGQGVNSYYNRIYIHWNGKKKTIIELLNSPIYYIDNKLFMNCFAGILGNTSLALIK